MRHYAGEVTYVSHGFREKNKDTLHPDLSAVMRTSSSAFVASLFAEAAPPAAAAAEAEKKGGGKKKGKASKADKATVGARFITHSSDPDPNPNPNPNPNQGGRAVHHADLALTLTQL